MATAGRSQCSQPEAGVVAIHSGKIVWSVERRAVRCPNRARAKKVQVPWWAMPDRPPSDVSPAQPPRSALGLGDVARKFGWAVADDGKGDVELVVDWYRQLVDHS